MHVVYYNSRYAAELREPSDLLAAHHGMHDWCLAARRAGVSKITVVQRFHTDATVDLDGLSHRLVADGPPGEGSFLRPPIRTLEAIVGLHPDVVHWNGRPIHMKRLRPLLPKPCAIVWQHHGGEFPRWYARPAYRDAFTAADVLFFTSRRQAQQWREANLFGTAQCAMEILEASTKMESRASRATRKELGIDGDPIILWVGHLDKNKDPLTVIRAFPDIRAKAPGTRLYMLFQDAPLQDGVEKAIATLKLQEAIRLVGRKPHDEMSSWYSAADYFVVGSRNEGSGFALLEALACGCFPVVPDLPAYRQITAHGAVGVLWKERTSTACAAAVAEALGREKDRQAVRSFFKTRLSYRALGENARRAYELAYEAHNGRPG